MSSLDKLISGYRIFKATIYPRKKDLATHFLQLGIKPKTLVVTSCSLQISPDELTSSNPGELYVIRNVGGIIPPYGSSAYGIIAAIEYAVKELYVENVVIIGHSHCDGIHLMMDKEKEKDLQGYNDPMAAWMHVIDDAKNAVRSQLGKSSKEEQETACEHEAVLVSLRNLVGYPFVKERISKNDVGIFGWHFDIETGALQSFNPKSKVFEDIL